MTLRAVFTANNCKIYHTVNRPIRCEFKQVNSIAMQAVVNIGVIIIHRYPKGNKISRKYKPYETVGFVFSMLYSGERSMGLTFF